jgi:hypothetical protein
VAFLESADRLSEKGRPEAAFRRALGDDREACEEGFGILRSVVSRLGQVKRADPALMVDVPERTLHQLRVADFD